MQYIDENCNFNPEQDDSHLGDPDKKKKKNQILIEDGTMAAFGYNNPCEVETVPNRCK